MRTLTDRSQISQRVDGNSGPSLILRVGKFVAPKGPLDSFTYCQQENSTNFVRTLLLFSMGQQPIII